jgi:DNA polymerase-3 subunit alpha
METPERMAVAAQALGLKVVGVADRELRSLSRFEAECVKRGIQPLFGLETEVSIWWGGIENRLALMVENEEGFNSITTLAYEARNHNGEVSIEALEANKLGLVAIAPTFTYPHVANIFDPNHLFLELTNFGDKESEAEIKAAKDMAAEFGAKLIASNRVWTTGRDYDVTISVILRARELGIKLPINWFSDNSKDLFRSNKQAYKFFNDLVERGFLDRRLSPWHYEGWLKPPAMLRGFNEFPEAVEATRKLAEQCGGLVLPKPEVPEFPVPEGETPFTYLQRLVDERINDKYQGDQKEARARLDYELEEIRKKGLESVYLIAFTIVEICKEKGIKEIGIGSANGSAVGFVLGISNVEPIVNGLSFERFINEEMKKKPDFDFNVDIEKVGILIDEVINKFADMGIMVARVGTFSKYGWRGAVREVLRIFGIKNKVISDIQNKLDSKQMFSTQLEAPIFIANALAKRNVEKGNVGTHGSKAIFLGKQNHEVIMYKKDGKGRRVAEINKEAAEFRANIDFVGNSGLSLTRRVMDRLGMEEVERNDPKTLAMIFRGETIGVPYLESRWLRKVVKQMGDAIRDKKFSEMDLALTFALSRPAARGSMGNYFRRRAGKESFKSAHKSINESEGLIIYQEQTLAIAEVLGDFPLAKREKLRKAISKERGKIKIGPLGKEFIDKAMEKGVPKRESIELFVQMAQFAKYGFLKGHVMSLMINNAYEAAYLKRHHPQEFFEELFDLQRNHYFVEGEPEVYVAEAKRMGVRLNWWQTKRH